MKGQLSVDFFISLTLFILIAIYLSFQVLNTVPYFLREVRLQNLRSELFQISEILLNDPGEPINWCEDPALTERIGLLDETKNLTNFLSLEKIRGMEEVCRDYDKFRSLIGSERIFLISIKELESGKILAACAPANIPKKQMLTIVRNFAFINETDQLSIGEMNIQIW